MANLNSWSLQHTKSSAKYQIYRSRSVISRSPQVMIHQETCVIVDSTRCIDAHIAKLCRSINFNLYSVGTIRKYLDRPTAEKMINATVTSRLDYCDCLLYGAKQSHIDDCSAARKMQPGLYLKGKLDHISSVLRELYWLPMEHRIRYKILPLTYKALNRHAPQCLAALISEYPTFGGLIFPQFTKMAAWKLLESELSPRQPQPLGTPDSKVHGILIVVCVAPRPVHDELAFEHWLCLDTHIKLGLYKYAIVITIYH